MPWNRRRGGSVTHPHRPRRCLQRGRRNDGMAVTDVAGGGGGNQPVERNLDNVERNTKESTAASSSSVGSPVIPVPRPRAATSKTTVTKPQWAANGADNTKLRRQSTWAYPRDAAGTSVWSSASFKESFKKRCQFRMPFLPKLKINKC